MLSRLKQALFGSYKGAETSIRRNTPIPANMSVDEELNAYKRRTAIENARDLDKNFAVASWAVRKHLDYVSAFSFEPNTGIPELDQQLRNLVAEYSLPDNCHVSRRHSLADIIRMAEAARVIDGDLLLVKLRSGHLQPIEGDRIANPKDQANHSKPGERQPWVNGVKTTKSGKAQRFGIWGRTNRGLDFERTVDADNCFHHGYFQRFDQVRGVSPLVSALNSFRDTYEVMDYALAKAKVSQLFGLVVNTNGQEETGDHTANSDGKYNWTPGQGIFKLELDSDESASFLESNTPSVELQDFSRLTLQIALKALDIPYSFFDESFTNFFGSRAAFIHYKKACANKVAQNQRLLDGITRWRLNGYALEGRLDSSVNVADLKFEWVPAGTPWWNPQQEVTADVMALKAGLTTRTQIVKEKFGKDWDNDILPTLLKEDEQLMATRGFLFDTSDAENLGEVPDE